MGSTLPEQIVFALCFVLFLVAFGALLAGVLWSFNMARKMSGLKRYLIPPFLLPFVLSDEALDQQSLVLKRRTLRAWALAAVAVALALLVLYIALDVIQIGRV